MAALTRRRNHDRNRESWRILYGDIEIGWIGQRSGVPKDVERWVPDWPFTKRPPCFCPVVSVFAFIAVFTSLLVHARDTPAERYCFGGVPSVF
jgi:hypothetical protein